MTFSELICTLTGNRLVSNSSPTRFAQPEITRKNRKRLKPSIRIIENDFDCRMCESDYFCLFYEISRRYCQPRRERISSRFRWKLLFHKSNFSFFSTFECVLKVCGRSTWEFLCIRRVGNPSDKLNTHRRPIGSIYGNRETPQKSIWIR